MSRLVAPFVAVLFALMPLAAAVGPTASARATAVSAALPAAQDEVVYVDAEGTELGLVTLQAVEDPYEGYREDSPPADDTRYVLLTVAFEATGDTAFDAGPNQLTLRDENGYLWGYASVPREDDSFPELQSQTLAPGNRISGVVGFIVPEDAELAQLYFQPESGRLILLADLREDPGPGPQVEDEVEFTGADGAEGLVFVREIEDPFEGYPEDRGPDQDTRYVLLTVAIENIGEPSFDASPSQVVLHDADGFLWGYTGIPREDESLPELQSQTLAPGNRISGVVGFIVPEDAELAQVYFQPESGRLIVIADLAQDAGGDEEEEVEDAEAGDTEEAAEDEEAEEAEEADEDTEAEEEEEEASTSGVDGTTYTSPTYGYTLEWDGSAWEVVEATSGEEGDALYLWSGRGTLSIEAAGDYDGDPTTCLEGEVDAFSSDPAIADWEPVEDDSDATAGVGDDRAWATFSLTLGGEDGDGVQGIVYLECRTLVPGEAVLVVINLAPADTYEEDAAAAQVVIDTIELADGGSAEAGENESGEESASGVDGSTYTSPTFGYEIEWDGRVWAVGNDVSEDGRDLLRLDLRVLGESRVFLEGFAFAGNAEACLDAYVAERVDSPSWRDYGPIPDLAAPDLPAEAPGANGVFGGVLTDREGREANMVQYVACWLLPGQEAVLRVTVQASSPDFYELDRPVVGKLLAGLRLPDAGTGDNG